VTVSYNADGFEHAYRSLVASPLFPTRLARVAYIAINSARTMAGTATCHPLRRSYDER
jgi:hypothetical protein